MPPSNPFSFLLKPKLNRIFGTSYNSYRNSDQDVIRTLSHSLTFIFSHSFSSSTDLKVSSSPLNEKPQTRISNQYLQRIQPTFVNSKTTALRPSPSSLNNLNHQLRKEVNQDSASLVPAHFEKVIYLNAISKRCDEAKQAFELMQDAGLSPTLKAWNCLILAYTKCLKIDDALSLFDNLQKANLSPNFHTYATIINGLVEAKKLDQAFLYFEQMQKSSIILNASVYTSLVKGCVQSGKFEKAWDLFNEMRLNNCKPDEVAFSYMIHAAAQTKDAEKALDLLEEMVSLSLTPTNVTFNSVINACAQRQDYFQQTFSLLAQMMDFNFLPDLYTYNTLLFACSKHGDLKKAHLLMKDLLLRHKEEQDFKEEGRKGDLLPNEITFTNLFWVYANVKPQKNGVSAGYSTPSQTGLVAAQTSWIECLETLLNQTQQNEPGIFMAQRLFNFLKVHFPHFITKHLANAYISVLLKHGDNNLALKEFQNLYGHDKLQPNGWSYLLLLRICVNLKDSNLLRETWDSLQSFKSGLSEQSLRTEGMKGRNERDHFVLYINGIAKLDCDIYRGIQLLQRYEELGHKAKLNNFRTLYQRVVETEDRELLQKLRVVFQMRRNNDETLAKVRQRKWHHALISPKNRTKEPSSFDFEPMT